MSKYQAIIFDLDGTAIPNSPEGMPSRRLVETARRAKDHIHLIAATGRGAKHALPVIEALGLTDPCIISGGTVLYDPVKRSVIRQTSLPAAAIEPLVSLAHQGNYTVYLRNKRLKPNSKNPIIDDVEIIYIEDIPRPKVSAFKQAIDAIPGVIGASVPSWNGRKFETFTITNIDATKEHAVADVLDMLHVPKTAAIGVGDGHNDLHLFNSVGLRVAMGNAEPRLKTAADIVTTSVEEDGLADIIKQFTPVQT